jgi:hypothetical protein
MMGAGIFILQCCQLSCRTVRTSYRTVHDTRHILVQPGGTQTTAGTAVCSKECMQDFVTSPSPTPSPQAPHL